MSLRNITVNINHTVPKIIGMFAYKTESITVGANATVHISFAFYTCTVYQAQKPVLIRHSKWRLCTVRITAFQSSMFPFSYCLRYTIPLYTLYFFIFFLDNNVILHNSFFCLKITLCIYIMY